MAPRLFCELCPPAYELSHWKGLVPPQACDPLSSPRFARERRPLPFAAGGADMRLRENEAVNLRPAAPRISGALIRLGEVFSFWRSVGPRLGLQGIPRRVHDQAGRAVAGSSIG